MNDKEEGVPREFTRVPVKVEAEISDGEKTIFCEQTHDVSMKGLFVHAKDRFAVDTRCNIALFPGGKEGGMCIEIKGVVVHSSDRGMGLQFTEIGMDSYTFLQNLVMYNSEDSHKVEQEIHNHLGLKRRE